MPVHPLLLLPLLAGAATLSEADVRPVFNGGALGAAKADFDAGRWEEAAAGLAASAAPEARLLRALALTSAHRGAEAASLLEGLDASLGEVSDRIHWWTGQALDDAGRPAEAAQAYARVPEGSLLWPDALLARARALRSQGDAAGALQALSPLAGLAPPSDLARRDAAASALLLAGDIRSGLGGEEELAAARQSYLACWSRHPLAPESRDCRTRLEALPAPHGAAPGVDEVLGRAEALLEANRNAAALAELDPLVARLADPPSDPASCRLHFLRGRAYRKERDYARAARELGPVVDRCPDPAMRARSLYVLAGAQANLRTGDGIVQYLRFSQEYPENSLADDALFFAADLQARDGRPEEARRTLEELADRYPLGDYRAEALFRAAWLARREGDRTAALALLGRLEEEYRDADPYEHARAAYWRARVLSERARRGDAASAKKAWKDLLSRYPTDYYGLLARDRLGPGAAAGPSLPQGPATEAFRYVPGPLASDRHFRAGVLLLRLGLTKAAADELNAVDRRPLSAIAGPAGADPLLVLAELLDRAGDHRSAHGLLKSQAKTVLRQVPPRANPRLWRIAYPPAYREEVQRWAPPAGVPVDLLQALMREESALDPLVVSPAGAVGLTQLMLPTAREVARRLDLPRPSNGDLMVPGLNIRLGAVHLGDLLRRFGGSAPLALAAYNAGESPVRAWWRARSGMALDEFVEEIPIQETRGYVKRVLRSYAAYRLLYGGGAGPALALQWKLPQPR